MSRGLGKVERLVLEQLKEHGGFYLTAILPPDYTAAEYQATWRAMRSLEQKRLIWVHRYAFGMKKTWVSDSFCRPTERPQGSD